MTEIWSDGEIDAAAAALRRGELVAFPTETVYGLGALACDAKAVAAVYAAKGRPAHNPLIAHVPGLAEALELAAFDDAGLRLAEAFWPGPLTLVAPLRPGAPLAPAVTAGLSSAAFRAPAHPLARRLLAVVGAPLVAPSANRSGRVSPVEMDHVLQDLDGRIAGVLDGGRCAVGVESTILACDPDGPVLLRPGGLAAEAIEAALGQPLRAAGGAVRAPGMLRSHYAPGARLRLGAAEPQSGEGWLGFGPSPNHDGPMRNLSESGDLAEAAANLFKYLREIDVEMGGAGVIAAAPIPQRGLGRAINDRLARAAAPRG